jgi:hypothetical protein
MEKDKEKANAGKTEKEIQMAKKKEIEKKLIEM